MLSASPRKQSFRITYKLLDCTAIKYFPYLLPSLFPIPRGARIRLTLWERRRMSLLENKEVCFTPLSTTASFVAQSRSHQGGQRKLCTRSIHGTEYQHVKKKKCTEHLTYGNETIFGNQNSIELKNCKSSQ